MIGRAVVGITALSCAAAAVWLAVHHPLSAPLAVAMTLLAGVAVARWPWVWPVMLPALLPLLGLAPWSGWISVEEMDLLVLAVATGGYARWALRPQPRRDGIDVGAALALLLLALWTASVLISLMRGISDAGGLTLDWYQAYRGPMNALRLAKPTLAVWLLLPLWLRLEATPGARATDSLTLGLALCHASAALACLYERLAYTGLLNFSADYRTAGMFWEVHVGGAGLDACLAMTFPFVWRLWATARNRWVSALSLGLLLLGVYAVLTTFSRILLLAVPLGILVMLWMQRHRGADAPTPSNRGSASRRQQLTFGILCVAIGLASAWLFVGAGYRGLIAVLGSSALLLILVPKAARLHPREWIVALAVAMALGPVWLVGAMLLPKGPYIAFALILVLSLATALGALRLPSATAMAAGGYWVAVACLGLVAWYWGDARGLHTAWPAMALLALALPLLATLWPDPWPDNLRWQAGAWALLGVMAMVIALVGGGSYMTGRVSASDEDRQDRVTHWRTALSMIDSDAARWLGNGLGRFLDLYAVTASAGHRPGDLRLADDDGIPVLAMATGTHVQGWGELLRLSQRIARPLQGPVTVRVAVRGAPGTSVNAEVCIKHLLYDDGCLTGVAALPKVAPATPPEPAEAATATATPGGWQTLTIVLQGAALPPDTWYLPRTTVFSLASENAQRGLVLREVSVVDGRGVEMIDNGRFQQGGARWFFSSDKYHLPWHAKNLAVHLLVEQGWLGLASMVAMTLAAFGTAIGRGRRLPLAPALAAALAGAWAVGLIDSLIDMPRIALLLLLLTTIAIAQRPTRSRTD